MSVPSATGLDALIAQLGAAVVYDLEHERYIGAPIHPAHWPGFVYTLHRRHEETPGQPRTSASGTVTMQEHSGTHIDALCHQAVELEMFGGRKVTPQVQTARGFTELGAETIPPIMRRGVLLDVAKARGVDVLPDTYLVTAADLQSALDSTGVTLTGGECLLVRTGSGKVFADPPRYLQSAGVGLDGAQWLADHEPFLCGADNVAFDVVENDDPEVGFLPSHTVLIVRNGIYIVENLNLEPLADAGCNEFLLLCLPLKMQGVTGSPVRPIAISLTS